MKIVIEPNWLDQTEWSTKKLVIDTFDDLDQPGAVEGLESRVRELQDFTGRLLEFLIKKDLMNVEELNEVLQPIYEVKEIVR